MRTGPSSIVLATCEIDDDTAPTAGTCIAIDAWQQISAFGATEYHISGSYLAGSSIRIVNSNASISCKRDTDTTSGVTCAPGAVHAPGDDERRCNLWRRAIGARPGDCDEARWHTRKEHNHRGTHSVRADAQTPLAAVKRGVPIESARGYADVPLKRATTARCCRPCVQMRTCSRHCCD
jgi:hypothetical protein